MMITQQEMLRRALEIQTQCADRRPDLREKIMSIRFRLSTRMTNAAGYARVQANLVKLSVPFFADEQNFSTRFFNTVTHEIAHILAPPTRGSGRTKRDVHGLAWQMMHRSLGGDGKRCHDMELSAAFATPTRKKYEVPCSQCGKPIKLGPTQYRRHEERKRLGLPGYRHARCP